MLRTAFALIAALSFGIFNGSTSAQEQANVPGPQKEHEWLQKFVGEWETTTKGKAGPDQPAMEIKGKISSRQVGRLWVINEMRADLGTSRMHGVQTIGYDPKKKKYVGTWVDSMMNFMWKYEGSVDESGNKINLDARGPASMAADGKPALYRDSYEFKTPDLIIVTSSVQNEDGEWVAFMTGEAKRVKNDKEE